MLTIPLDGVKFRRHDTPTAVTIASETVVTNGRNRWRLPRYQASPQAAQKATWHGVVLQSLKRNDISLVPYVPDRVLTTLIKNMHADPFFTTFPTAREEEAVGIVSGAWMAGCAARC